jgi:hypothetical protein
LGDSYGDPSSSLAILSGDPLLPPPLCLGEFLPAPGTQVLHLPPLIPPLMEFSGINFHLGVGVQAAIRDHFGEHVNFFPESSLKEFFLLVSVGRCKYMLNEKYIGHILQATLGGCVVDFRPQPISDQVFKFVVASHNVGFHIYNLRSYSCKQYKVFFHLWSNGGAHWISELTKYEQEEDDQWTMILSKKSRRAKSYADVVC